MNESTLNASSTIRVVPGSSGKNVNTGLKTTQRKVRSVLRSNVGWMAQSRGGTQ